MSLKLIQPMHSQKSQFLHHYYYMPTTFLNKNEPNLLY